MKRKIFIGIFSIATAIMAMTALQSCQKEKSIRKLSFESSRYVFLPKAYQQVYVVSDPSDAEQAPATWTSSDESVATVSRDLSSTVTGTGWIAKGEIRTVGVGKTMLSVDINGHTAFTDVIVADAQFASSRMSLTTGTTDRIEVTVLPEGENLQDSVLNWQSANPDIATVDSDGNITAKASGETVISVRFINETLKCEVTVSDFASQVTWAEATASSCLLTCSYSFGHTAQERGVCWSDTDTEPTVDDNTAVASSGNGQFDVNAEGLAEKTRYYVRPYCRWDDRVYYGLGCFIETARVEDIYLDEYGITRWGVNLGTMSVVGGVKDAVWAPVPCGYKEPDASGRGYPHGKLYQMGRRVGQGRGEITWNDPADHARGGRFTDEGGRKITVVCGSEPLALEEVTRADTLFINEAPYRFWEYTGSEQPTEKDQWYGCHAYEYGDTDFHSDETNPCPCGYSVVGSSSTNQGAIQVLTECHVHYRDNLKIYSKYDFSECPQGIAFDMSQTSYRNPDGTMQECPTPMYWYAGGYYKDSPHRQTFQLLDDGTRDFKTRNGDYALSIRCVRQ